jgi:hypothetical protein
MASAMKKFHELPRQGHSRRFPLSSIAEKPEGGQNLPMDFLRAQRQLVLCTDDNYSCAS